MSTQNIFSVQTSENADISIQEFINTFSFDNRNIMWVLIVASMTYALGLHQYFASFFFFN